MIHTGELAVMDSGKLELSDGCSWYAHRLNVVPCGGPGNGLAARFVDSLTEARRIADAMLSYGATDVSIYDPVEGTFLTGLTR